MAWVTMISKTGDTIKVPQGVYNNMYKGNEFYSILESEPSPKIKEEKREEVVKDEPIQKSESNEDKFVRKSPKKTVS